ncbi:MAG: hypothetical protein ABIQ29_01985 [Burkholderiaceae bacterium]
MYTPLSPLVPTHSALLPCRAPLRRVLSQALHNLSQRLDRLAEQLASNHVGRSEACAVPSVEFHAEAGAPEGALYIDGVLAGHLAGVSRL